MRHVVLSHWVNNKVLVASRALCWPVLVAFLLWTEGPAPMIRWGGMWEGISRFQRILGQDSLGGDNGGVRGYTDEWLGVKGKKSEGVAGTRRALEGGLTLPISRSLVSMTMMVELCSHSMRQKSSVLSARGPCVAM